jgi:hypothetical protein
MSTTNHSPSPNELRLLQQQSKERRVLSSARTQQREKEAYAKKMAAAGEEYAKVMITTAPVTQGHIIDLRYYGARPWLAPAHGLQ